MKKKANQCLASSFYWGFFPVYSPAHRDVDNGFTSLWLLTFLFIFNLRNFADWFSAVIPRPEGSSSDLELLHAIQRVEEACCSGLQPI